MTTEDFDHDVGGKEFPASSEFVVKKKPPSARCSIVASAFHAATSGAVRRQLKGKSALALIVLVPGPSWIRPVRDLFVSRFGNQWQAVETEALKTPQQKSDRNGEVAADLARGRPVIGVAVDRNALPTALTMAADLIIRINAPNGATITRAIRMFIPASSRQRALTRTSPSASNSTISSRPFAPTPCPPKSSDGSAGRLPP